LSGDILFDIEGFRNYSEMEIDREFQFSRDQYHLESIRLPLMRL